MTQKKERMEHLSELEIKAKALLQKIADIMAEYTENSSSVSQETWDRLFQDWNEANDIMQKCAKARGE